MHRRLLPAALLLCLAAPTRAQLARFIDPAIGTDGGGNTIIGPSLPFGMIKPGPDIGRNTSNSGWEPAGPINGFSQTHVSGTGGGPKYGNILLQPTVGDIQPAGYGSDRAGEQASAGLYSVTLQRYHVRAELTASRRTALYRLTYPETRQANILFDMGHCLSAFRLQLPQLGPLRDDAEDLANRLMGRYLRLGEAQFVTASSIHVLSPTELSGSTTVTGGWNKQANTYTVFFYAVTDTPAHQWGTWHAGRLHPGNTSEHDEDEGKTGAWLTLSTHANQQVLLKLGISFVSIEQAKRNAVNEIPGFDFDRTHAEAVAAWDKALSPLEVSGAGDDQSRMLYTSLYHTMLMPVDRTGENPLWHSAEPCYDDLYAIWDTFRTSNPLLTLLAPEREAAIVRSLIDTSRHEGWMPDARSGNASGRTQGGSNADMILGDAFVKALPGIDWRQAYAAMKRDAEIEPPDPINRGRAALSEWKTLGYISTEGGDRPASRTMEYAANDFELALVAQGLGLTADEALYRQRSGNWQNLWDENFTDGGFSGFIRPRNRRGAWKKNFTALQTGSWGSDTFYEGNSWTYSTYVPQDVRRLIERSGGPASFVKRLDALFAVPGRFDVSNEPGFLAPYLYLWAGRPDKANDHIRSILAQGFHPTPSGLPGNDDSGAMSSWYVFSTLGLFPVAGQDVYLIGAPSLPEVTLHLANAATFRISAQNLSPANRYVTNATLNGKPIPSAWLRHRDLTAGGTLILTMGPHPTAWPQGPPPPSSSDPR